MSDVKDYAAPPSKPPEPSKDQPAPEEVAALLNGLAQAKKEIAEQPSDLEIACAGGMNVVTIPARITVSYKGCRFLADQFRSWAWTPFGVLAIGRWEDDPEDHERHIVIHGDQLIEVELQIEPYEDALAEANAKAGLSPPGSGVPVGTEPDDETPDTAESVQADAEKEPPRGEDESDNPSD